MVGQIVGKYKVIDRVGRGGMGTVYRAVDEMLHREVAIKVLNAELNDPEVAKRFRAEAITVARLSHPGIATIYELFQHDGQWLMVMEFVRGETLEHMVERMGPLSPQRSAELCMQSLAALAHAHSMGVVHRDLKPANLMITETGAIKIMDFGIARVAGTEHLTNAGYMMGTPAYMSPEQVRGEEIDARADLYAMGVVFYRLTTAKLPFKGETPFAMAQSQVNDPPTPLAMFRTDLPPWVEPVIARALAKGPEERFQSAAEFHEAFARCLAGLPLSTMYGAGTAPTEMLRTPGRPMPTGAFGPRTAAIPGSPFPASGPFPTALAPSATQPTMAAGLPTDDPSSAATVLSPSGALAQSGTGGVASPSQPTQIAGTTAPPGAAGSPGAGSAGSSGPAVARKKPNTVVLAGAAAGVVILAAGGWALFGGASSPPASGGDAAAVETAPPPSGSAPAPLPAPAPTGDLSQPGAPVAPGAQQAPPASGAGTPGQAGQAGQAGQGAGVAPGGSQPAAAPAGAVAVKPAPTAPAAPAAGKAAADKGAAAPPALASGKAAPGQATPAAPSGTTGPAAASPAGTKSGAAGKPASDDALITFPNVKVLAVNGRRASDRDVVLNFAAGSIAIMPREGGEALRSVPYRQIVRMTYVKANKPRWDDTLPAPPADLDVGGGILNRSRHWLIVQTKEAYVILRLEDGNAVRILDTLESRTGLKVERPQ